MFDSLPFVYLSIYDCLILLQACEKGHLSIVKQLLEADPECQHIADKKGLKPRDFVHAESDDLLQIFRNFDTWIVDV